MIKQQPVGQSVSKGDTLVLTCIADCSPPPTYQWYWEGNLIPNKYFPQLKVENVQSHVTGKYRCRVINKQIADPKHNYVWSDTVQVEIVKHPVQGTPPPSLPFYPLVPLTSPRSSPIPYPFSSLILPIPLSCPISAHTHSSVCLCACVYLHVSSSVSDDHVDQYMSSVPSSMTTSSSSSSSFPPTSLNSGPLSGSDSRSLSSLRSRSGNSRNDQTDGGTPTSHLEQSTSMTSLSSTSSSSMNPSVPDSDSDIKLTKPLTDMTFKYNEPVILDCQAKSMSGKELTFTWFKKKGSMYNFCTCACIRWIV